MSEQHAQGLPALATLQSKHQWVCWREEKRDGNLTKVPYNPQNGRHAKSNDPQTWASYARAVATWKKQPKHYSGIGFMFTSEGNITGIDLDHCIAPDGTIDAWAQHWIDQLQSYTEYSPSREGLHIYVEGTFPKPTGTRHVLKDMRHPKAAIEVYSQGRYFTITTKHLTGTLTTIEPRQAILDTLHDELTRLATQKNEKAGPMLADLMPTSTETSERAKPAPIEPAPTEQSTIVKLAPTEHTSTHTVNLPLPPLDDQLVLKKAEDASNGGKFRSLYYGGTIGDKSPSEADFSLSLILAFWTGRDIAQMDRLFRKSALYREKWDSPRGGSTYGHETLLKAASLCTEVYDPCKHQGKLTQDIDRLIEQITAQQGKHDAHEEQTDHPAEQIAVQQDKHDAGEQQEGHLVEHTTAQQVKRDIGKKRERSEKYEVSKEQLERFQLKPAEIEMSKILSHYSNGEVGDSFFFADAFAGQVRYDHDEKAWYLWQGHNWQRDDTAEIRLVVAWQLGQLYIQAGAKLAALQAEVELQIRTLEQQKTQEDGGFHLELLQARAKRLRTQAAGLHARGEALHTNRRMNSVLSFIESGMGMTADTWDKKTWLLAVHNGVIDLRTGKLCEGNPDDYIRTAAPTDWLGLDAPCPRFEQFLREIFEDKPDREEIIAFLQRLLGYSLTGVTTEHIFPILAGIKGRNGKDTLLTVLSTILGKHAGAVSKDIVIAQQWGHSNGAATPHLCDLQGKRLAWVSETNQGDRLSTAQVKELTGGGALSVRQLYGRQYSFVQTHKLLLSTNYKPAVNANDDAFWSRACLIDFGMHFVDDPKKENDRLPDKNLQEKLEQETSGILAWLVRGCLDWQQQGLNIPPSIKEATRKYRKDEDPLQSFLQECCVVAEKAQVKAQKLYEAFCNWFDANRFQFRIHNGKEFGEEMAKRFSRGVTHGCRIYHGIGLLADYSPTLFGDATYGCNAGKACSSNGEDAKENTGGVGGGSLSNFSQNTTSIVTTEKSLRETLTPLTPSLPVHIPEPTPATDHSSQEQAEHHPLPAQEEQSLPEQQEEETQSLPEQEQHPCTTRYEGYREVAHEADATHLGAGYWWCEQCAPQREFMELGERMKYSGFRLRILNTIVTVHAGQSKWLCFAQEAGYTYVMQALAAIKRAHPQADSE